MANGPPSTSAGPSTTAGSSASSSSAASASQPAQRLQALQQQAAAAQAASQPGNIYSFSVHQPYPNWPLHSTGATYAPSWYALPPHYATTKTYKEDCMQTDSEEIVEARLNQQEGKSTYRKHWDSLFAGFLKNAGLYQALHGFEEDMLLVNEEWERNQIPLALKQFVRDMTSLFEKDGNETLLEKPLEERKLEHVKFPKVVNPQTPSSVTKSISRLLRDSKRRNNASNRSEFLQSLAEKRQRLKQSFEGPEPNKDQEETAEPEVKMELDLDVPSCARVDAKTQNRDVQMKYDIAKNEDGPLKRTMKSNRPGHGEESIVDKGKQRANGSSNGVMEVTAEKHPGLAARFTDVETHLAVRYVPAPPQSLFDRMKFLEDHIILLEREYPPWAALHFNQPRRGWPPPPRLTPIIVPSHLTSATQELSSSSLADKPTDMTMTGTGIVSPSGNVSTKANGRGRGRGKSSLHRAVMEKLEVQKAMGDLSPSTTGVMHASGTGVSER